MLQRWADTIRMHEYKNRIVDIDESVVICAANLCVPDQISDRDCFIAATAEVHGLMIVTRNIKDFESFNVGCLNPWIMK